MSRLRRLSAVVDQVETRTPGPLTSRPSCLRSSTFGRWFVEVYFSEFDQLTLIVLAIHRAIHQPKKLVLGEQTLAGHLTQEVVGDVADFGGVAGLGPSPGLPTVSREVDEVMMVAFRRQEALGLE
jgi:hypothetical protein